MTSPLKPIVHLRTSRLVLRNTLPEDAEDYTDLFSDPHTTEYEPHKPDLSVGREKLLERYTNAIPRMYQSTADGKGAQLFIRAVDEKNELGGRVIGQGGINGLDPVPQEEGGGFQADFGLTILSKEWRKGYGKEALGAIFDYIFDVTETPTSASARNSTINIGESITQLAKRKSPEPVKITRAFAQSLASNLPFQSVMTSIGLPGKRVEGGPFGPEFEFKFTKGEWLQARSKLAIK